MVLVLPTVSLMGDMERRLKKDGFEVIVVRDDSEILITDFFQVFIVTYETINNSTFTHKLTKLAGDNQLGCIVFDEAQVVLLWSFFRKIDLCINFFSRYNVSLIFLSGTFPNWLSNRLKTTYDLQNLQIHKEFTGQDGIAYFRACLPDEVCCYKYARQLIESIRPSLKLNDKLIIYCSTTVEADKMLKVLKDSIHTKVKLIHINKHHNYFIINIFFIASLLFSERKRFKSR